MVDRAALEMRCTGNCTGGSNPSLSAENRPTTDENQSSFFVCVCRCASPRPRQTKITSLRLSVDFQHRARDSELRKGVARIVLYLLLDLKICAEKESSRVRAETRPSNPSLSAKTNEAKRCRGIDTFLFLYPVAQVHLQTQGVKTKVVDLSTFC